MTEPDAWRYDSLVGMGKMREKAAVRDPRPGPKHKYQRVKPCYSAETIDDIIPPTCPICGEKMNYSTNAEAWICGPSGSGCEGTLTTEEVFTQKTSDGVDQHE